MNGKGRATGEHMLSMIQGGDGVDGEDVGDARSARGKQLTCPLLNADEGVNVE
jgi:hypothetical protein